MWTIALPLLAAAAAQPPAQPEPAQSAPAQLAQADVAVAPAAVELLQRDWVLMNWALKYFDENHDILLEPDEARAAAAAFRKLADTDQDGRVTPEEYRTARALILSHY